MASITTLLDKAKSALTQKNVMTAVHWIAVITAAVISIGTTVFVPGTEKVAGYGLALMAVSIAQVIHKFTDALDHQATLIQAVQVTLPAIQAAAAGNATQIAEVKAVAQSVIDPIDSTTPHRSGNHSWNLYPPRDNWRGLPWCAG